MNDRDRTRKQDHAVAIYSVLEDGKEVWKVCDILTAITGKIERMHDYKKWLSMDLINYLDATDTAKSFGIAEAFDDPGPDNVFIEQNANDLKLYFAKYTPDYARNFIQNMGEELHIRNINSIAGKSEELKIIQCDFLLDFMKNKAEPDMAPNV